MKLTFEDQSAHGSDSVHLGTILYLLEQKSFMDSVPFIPHIGAIGDVYVVIRHAAGCIKCKCHHICQIDRLFQERFDLLFLS